MFTIDSGQSNIQTINKSTNDSSIIVEIEEIGKEIIENGTIYSNINHSKTILLTMHSYKDDRYTKKQFINQAIENTVT